MIVIIIILCFVHYLHFFPIPEHCNISQPSHASSVSQSRIIHSIKVHAVPQSCKTKIPYLIQFIFEALSCATTPFHSKHVHCVPV